jgi:hypothetical protein
VWKHKQTTLEQYSGYGKPGECGNPLVSNKIMPGEKKRIDSQLGIQHKQVIDSSGDEEDVASKPIPSDLVRPFVICNQQNNFFGTYMIVLYSTHRVILPGVMTTLVWPSLFPILWMKTL